MGERLAQKDKFEGFVGLAHKVSPTPWKMTRKEFVTAARPYMGSAAAVVRPVDSRCPPELAAMVRKAQAAAMPHYREVEAAWAAEHRGAILEAILAGKRIPSRVLKDYPEMERTVRTRPDLVWHRDTRHMQKRQAVRLRQRRKARSGISTIRQGGLR